MNKTTLESWNILAGWDFSGQVATYAKIELSDLFKTTHYIVAEQGFEPKAHNS